jgi:hypothetical protein
MVAVGAACIFSENALCVACTYNRFAVPTQGSPKFVFVAPMEKVLLPSETLRITLPDMEEWHPLMANVPHVPVGVP